jgi:ketol-acid reductoisomerase
VFATHVRANLRAGAAVVVAHGFALRYGLLDLPASLDVMLLAPRLPGRYVRERFLAGSGAPAYVDVVQDATGRAWPRLLALARGIGATRVGAFAVNYRDETDLDLFSEHFTFPLIFRALEVAFDELVAAGYPPEIAVMELHGSGELGQVLSRAAEVGLYAMLQADGSPACRYGVLTHREVVVDGARLAAAARATIGRIVDGSFARDLLDDQRADHQRLQDLTSACHRGALSEAERSLRYLLRVQHLSRLIDREVSNNGSPETEARSPKPEARSPEPGAQAHIRTDR